MFYNLFMDEIIETKWCTGCYRFHSVVEFSFRNHALGVLQPACKRCQSERARNHYLRNMATYLQRAAINNKRIKEKNRERLREYLSVQKCSDCGLNELAVLEFDHRDPHTKRNDVSTLVGTACSWSAIISEINKC